LSGFRLWSMFFFQLVGITPPYFFSRSPEPSPFYVPSFFLSPPPGDSALLKAVPFFVNSASASFARLFPNTVLRWFPHPPLLPPVYPSSPKLLLTSFLDFLSFSAFVPFQLVFFTPWPLLILIFNLSFRVITPHDFSPLTPPCFYSLLLPFWFLSDSLGFSELKQVEVVFPPPKNLISPSRSPSLGDSRDEKMKKCPRDHFNGFLWDSTVVPNIRFLPGDRSGFIHVQRSSSFRHKWADTLPNFFG